MTGIERLHKLIADIDVSADLELWYILRGGTEDDWDCEEHDDKTLKSTLAAIADQIEREQGAHVSRMRVLAVVTDMERHVSGVEGMEDSPVARWARDLRGALVGNGRDPAADVSMSAYDLLPDEDREALAWVRDHGGLESVKKLLDWVVGHCSTKQQLDFDFWLSGRVMYELGFEEDMADRDEVERRLLARLMPEGYEWPRYEDGEPVRVRDKIEDIEVRSIVFNEGGILLSDCTSVPGWGTWRSYKERVKRPAPKVYDADGAEIREGDRVWSTKLDEPHEWIVIDPHEDRGDSQTVLVSIGDRTGHARPEDLTHRAPVLAAGGKPLRKRETVYEIETGERYFVTNVFDGMTEPDFPEHTVECRKYEDVVTHMFKPDQLTHERPDSWERIEEDAGCTATKYNERRGTIFTTKQQVTRDLVRRCRALAERERGER